MEGYGVPEEKITVLPPGVIVRDWQRPQPRTPHATGDVVKVLFVGGDLERKGGHLLLEAFRTLRDSGLGMELHLVTKDRVPQEPGVFVYNSMQPNSSALKALYHACDIFALPTSGDCLPMVLSEAGVSGMAVISTDVAGIPEIVRDGKTGMIIPTGSVPHLIEALRALATRPELRLELGTNAMTHVSKTYDAEKNADRLIGLLKAEATLAANRSR
jgi:glycosyltransferase involved in cell wall biosynthesis